MLDINRVEKNILTGEVRLPASKSISHRYLIIQALSDTGATINNLSDSNDTILLKKALQSVDESMDFEDAGTPLRFFLACAALKNKKVTLTGSEGLKQRPVAPLVDALSQLGCRIEYLEREGFIPLKIIHGIDRTKNSVTLDAGISSQFLSALLLIAPGLPNGLTIKLKGNVASKPYIDLTIDCMKRAGVNVLVNDQVIVVPGKPYQVTNELMVEADWSAATFIYAWAAVSGKADIFLPGLTLDSFQGDRVTAYLFEFFGVSSKLETGGMRLSKAGQAVPKIKVDFTAIPDMFPAIAVTCAMLKMDATFTGIKNLTIKESNRLLAMKENLEQTGAILTIENEQQAKLVFNEATPGKYHFKSFKDHRIAMACSIFALHRDLSIDDETVVKKSFPHYWDALKKMGIIK